MSDSKNKEELRWKFPMILEEFGYKFNSEGRLRTIENDTYFQYFVSNDECYNQARYEAIRKALTEEIYKPPRS